MEQYKKVMRGQVKGVFLSKCLYNRGEEMKIQERIIGNDKIIQIYLNQEENDNSEIQQKIEKLKEDNKVVLFISGENETQQTLKNMVNIMKNL